MTNVHKICERLLTGFDELAAQSRLIAGSYEEMAADVRVSLAALEATGDAIDLSELDSRVFEQPEPGMKDDPIEQETTMKATTIEVVMLVPHRPQFGLLPIGTAFECDGKLYLKHEADQALHMGTIGAACFQPQYAVDRVFRTITITAEE